MYHLWFLEWQWVLPLLRLHLPRHHFLHRIPYLMSTETPNSIRKKWKYEWGAAGKPAAWIHRHRKTKLKMENWKKYKEIYCMTCRIGCRCSKRIWSMKVVLQSHGETLSLDIEALPVLLMNYQGSREQKWNLTRVSTVYLHSLPERPKLRYLLEDENNKASRTRCAGTVGPKAETFGDSNYCGSQNSQWRKWITHQSSIRRCGKRFGNTVVAILLVQNKNSQEIQKSLMMFLEPMRKPKVIHNDNTLEFDKSCEELSGITVRQHHTDQKQMGLPKEQCAESRKGPLRCCCSSV